MNFSTTKLGGNSRNVIYDCFRHVLRSSEVFLESDAGRAGHCGIKCPQPINTTTNYGHPSFFPFEMIGNAETCGQVRSKLLKITNWQSFQLQSTSSFFQIALQAMAQYEADHSTWRKIVLGCS